MAHVVGVPKRDPCSKCNLPVFLAERLAVGKRVYHRTCLKCARCGSQLTPGSFYETENDGEYVCETCPDEELNNDNKTPSSPFQAERNDDDYDVELRGESATNNSLALPSKPMRSSIADRLAFFEQTNQSAHVDQKLLQKSLSDEEKSLSLKRMEQMNGSAGSAYKPSNAFSQFMHDTTDSELRAETPDASDTTTTPTGTSTNPITHMDTSDTEDETDLNETDLNETKPKLPVTQPPADLTAITPKPRFTATAALKLQQTEKEVDVHATPNSMQQKTESQMQLHDVTNNNEQIQVKEPATTLDLSVRNVSEESITKESAITENLEAEEVPEEKERKEKRAMTSMQITLSDQQQETTEDANAVELRERNSETPLNHDNETIERLSVVRARLQQFEVIAKTTVNENDEKSQLSLKNAQDQQQATDLEQIKMNIEEHDGSTEEEVTTAAVVETNTDGQQMETKTYEQQVPLENVAINLDSKSRNEEEKLEESKEMKDDDIAKLNDNKIGEQSSEAAIEMNVDGVMEVSEKDVENTDKSNKKSSETEISKMQIDAPSSEVKDRAATIESDTKAASTQKTIKEMLAEDNSTTSSVISNISTTSAVTSNISTTTSNASSTLSKSSIESYPKDLDPFKSDDEDDDDAENEVLQNKENLYPVQMRTPQPRSQNQNAKSQASLNPFDSSDDEIELEKSAAAGGTPGAKVPPPRPPPPRISRNPFGDEQETEVHDDSLNFSRRSSLNSSGTKTRTPVPTPRSNLSQSQNPTPEPTPRLSNKSAQSLRYATPNSSNGHGDYYGSDKSLTTALTPQSSNLHRNSDLRSSNNSLASSSGGTMRARKSRRAPLPPGVSATPSAVSTTAPAKELFPSSETINSSTSIASSPSTSTRASPKSARKKRPAPAPPKPARLETANIDITVTPSPITASKNSFSYPLQSELDSKLSDEEKALLEGKPAQLLATMNTSGGSDGGGGSANTTLSRQGSRRIIPLDVSLLDDPSGSGDGEGRSDDFKTKLQQQGELENGDSQVIFRRRLLVPPKMETPTHESNPLLEQLQNEHDRQLEKLKDNKEAQNRNRQSHASTGSSLADELESALYYNKSAHGKWKRRKGPAPALPVPARRILQMLPLQEIRQELDIIEVQQQGLEKQGVILEKMIRDRCEDEHGQPLEQRLSQEKPEQPNDGSSGSGGSGSGNGTQNSKEVEDLILQLFELVNEKNELFRRQAELMYLRRQHRLEQEQADLEYEIRVLMAQPERNKTDTDKAREEALIARLVEVVQLRNDVVESLEMDRLREHEEDMSIKQRLEMHTSMRDSELGTDECKQIQKLSKKEKKKQKEVKKLKNKKLDVDKDADESELKVSEKDKEKSKKKKKKFLFIN